ncbi:ATP-grasp domain-containing protein [Kitasatospora viridis]|uniref:ATP-grasp domain-containing protein n=1 Tax=Kitasatospora viridis TaxID=281105 RepID=A0A561T658_9ACTN|nr:biotin carboxylase [Kitasatospora viridis]TWF82588.1 hypothetical protein FHX73_1470 [Kitasatospora viridis]
MSHAPLYLVINRFEHEFAEYHRYVDPAACRLAYITTPAGLAGLRTDRAVGTEVVDTLDPEPVLAAARRLAAAHGRPAAVAALAEYDVLAAAQVREELGVAGGHPLDLVRRFRDKPVMKGLVEAAGLRTPRFLTLDAGSAADPQRIADTLGLPLLLKPRTGVAARGIQRIGSTAELAEALRSVDPAGYECEEFVPGAVLHVDGLRRAGQLRLATASEYINTCLAYTADGEPLGSVLLDDGPQRTAAIRFADRCLDALDLADGAFHLELIRHPGGELHFLEVGLRVGGGPVAFLHRDLFGIDLHAESFRAAIGLPPRVPADPPLTGTGGGWLLMPEPRPLPSRVLARNSMRGVVPEVYHEALPAVGTVLDGTGGFDRPGGVFRLKGDSAAAVHRAARAVIAGYDLKSEHLQSS